LSNEELDDSTRDSDWKKYLGGMHDLSISIQFKYTLGNPDHQFIMDAVLQRTVFEVAIFSGDIATTGSEGLKTPVQIITNDLPMSLSDVTMIDVTLRPTYLYDTVGAAVVEPTWETIP
jgi:hypothetical protein